MCYNEHMNTRTERQDLESTHITLPSDLKREARIRAIREGKTLSEVIRELLAEYVKR